MARQIRLNTALYLLGKLEIWLFLIFVSLMLILFVSDILTQKRLTPGLGLPSKMVIYYGKSNPFSIEYPETWTPYELSEVKLIDDRQTILKIMRFFYSHLKISLTMKISTISTMDDVIQWGKKKAQELKGYQEIGANPYSTENINGVIHQFYYYEDSMWGEGTTYHCKNFYFFKSTRGYEFSMCARKDIWPEIDPVFYLMIESLKVE